MPSSLPFPTEKCVCSLRGHKLTAWDLMEETADPASLEGVWGKGDIAGTAWDLLCKSPFQKTISGIREINFSSHAWKGNMGFYPAWLVQNFLQV